MLTSTHRTLIGDLPIVLRASCFGTFTHTLLDWELGDLNASRLFGPLVLQDLASEVISILPGVSLIGPTHLPFNLGVVVWGLYPEATALEDVILLHLVAYSSENSFAELSWVLGGCFGVAS